MSATQLRNQLKQSIAAAFTQNLPSSIPQSVRDDIIESNLKIGKNLASAIFSVLSNTQIDRVRLQNLLSGANPVPIKLTDLM